MVHPALHRRTRVYLLLLPLVMFLLLFAGIAARGTLADVNLLVGIGASLPTMPGVLVAAGASGAHAVSASPRTCMPGWGIVPSIDPGTSYNGLYGIAAVATNDVWAVGGYLDDNSGSYETLAEHWNGTAFSVVSTPNQPSSDDELNAVAAVTASDVWAVGDYGSNPIGSTLVEHWNGTAWSIVPSPNLGTSDILKAVTVVSANDIWAVGEYQDSGPYQTLTEHWNGTAWSVVSSPDQGTDNNFLSGVAAAATNDVWAVGSYTANSADNSLLEHWNGTSWSIVTSPDGGSSELLGVVAVASNDVWAVGDYLNNSMHQTLTEHWNGTAWSVVSSPNDGVFDELFGVDAISAADVWAVGAGSSGTLTEHWDGSAWTIVPSPNPDPYLPTLYAVSAVSTNDVWASGRYEDDNNFQHTIAEHFSGCNSTPSPTATAGLPSPSPTRTATRTPTQALPTSTVSTPTSSTTTVISTVTSTSVSTATATAATAATATTAIATNTVGTTATSTAIASATPTIAAIASPTACVILFSDVPPGSTFYAYIRCLACLGLINGYPNGTFKPNNNVTRGQLSKIVSNAAGFSDPQPNQMFQDVPVGSTFQVYIGRLASRGYINGYPCGGAGEPCVPPANLPYFRPNANATRGQISKIVSNAAGFSDRPSGQQFQDVPIGSTYYTYTYRLVTRGVMGGYPCGGSGEPCVPPGNLPYFRPNNDATRGQTSKIVSNTFFPDCSPPSR